jgi:hypothetical protein
MKGYKYCGGCGIFKLLSQFYSHQDTHDGKQTRCIDCDRTRLRNYYHTSKGKVKRPYYVSENMYMQEII